MPQSQFEIPAHHIRYGLNAVIKKGEEDGYGDLIDATVESYNGGKNPEAPLVPYVQFILDATLQTLERFDPLAAFPEQQHEVLARENVACRYVTAFNYYGVEPFAEIYSMYTFLDEIMDTEEEQEKAAAFMADRKYMASLGRSAFGDVRMAAGGAVKFLKEQRPDINGQDTRRIIVASEDLRHMGAIPKTKGKRAFRNLGEPYINTSRFAFNEQAETVVFNDETKDYLNRLGSSVPNSGCPANQIAYNAGGEGPKINAMREGWRDITRCLVTDQATADIE
jgi:hypothetical protein